MIFADLRRAVCAMCAVAGLVPAATAQQPQAETEQGTAAVLRALDKVNGRVFDAEVVVGSTVEMLGVLVTVSGCRYPADNPTGDAFAFLTVRNPDDARVYFDGWMFASSPALNALDHNRYDVWVMRCTSS